MNQVMPSDIDFIVVGAEKSGTTWLAEMLWQHPGIFVPRQKELHYFNRQLDEAPEIENYNFNKPVGWYLRFYEEAPPGVKMGECCPAYLWDAAAPQRIHDFNPLVKIVMILRNPVERFLSAYRYLAQRGVVTTSDFHVVLQRHRELLLDRGAYHPQVRRYLDLFPPGQVRVYWFDDLRREASSMLLDIEAFIGVEPFVPENVNEEINVTQEPRSPWVSRMLARVKRFTRKYRLSVLIELARSLGAAEWFTNMRDWNKQAKKPSKPPVVDTSSIDRQWLYDHYREDIEQLERLLQVDLTSWKSPSRT